MRQIVENAFFTKRIKLIDLVESKIFERTVVVIILCNAFTLGLETTTSLSPNTYLLLNFLDKVFLSFFILELTLKAMVYRMRFFSDPWRIFDLVVVSVALFPESGPFSILRALRALRTLRMVSVVPSLRQVVIGLLKAIPGLGAVGTIMSIVFYISAVMATQLFKADFPQWFGTIGESSYTLFQIMTLESWSMGIVRPVMEKQPYAWLFFIPFILTTTFVMLNLFIAVIVNAMQADTETLAEEREQKSHDERAELLFEIQQIRKKLDELSIK